MHLKFHATFREVVEMALVVKDIHSRQESQDSCLVQKSSVTNAISTNSLKVVGNASHIDPWRDKLRPLMNLWMHNFSSLMYST